MENLIFECLWNEDADRVREDVKTLWRKYRAVEHESRLETRAREIVYVIRSREGDVGGVSTARPVQVKFLNNHFFYEFRCFISPPHRAPGLDSALAVKTKSFLEQQEGSGTKFKGLLMIVENEEIKRQRTKAVWPASEMVFAGYTPEGHHIRVGYFKNARI